MNYIYGNENEMNKLLNRFIRYVKVWSESDEKKADEGKMPSTEQQWDLAKMLVKELRNLGTRNVYLTDFCYVVAKIDSNIIDPQEREKYPSILLMAHIDTSDEVSGKDVKPVISVQSAENSLTHENDTIIKTDGTTLLGADDKAGVSAIMTAVEFLMNHYEDFPHGPIEIVFSPDEETGHGMDKVPLNIIKSKMAVTVDGGDEGELESECFNAFSCCVRFTGKACHTGYAKQGGMVNAVRLASKFVSLLPENMLPEITQDYEGFISPMDISGTIERACVNLLLRSFDMKEIEKEKTIILNTVNQVTNELGGQADVQFNEQYLNMKEKMLKNPEILNRLEKAYEDSGVKIVKKPIRGGTDGSRLTQMGIPTPNIFTGGHEFHSKNEWASLNQMAKAADVIINLLIQKNK